MQVIDIQQFPLSTHSQGFVCNFRVHQARMAPVSL